MKAEINEGVDKILRTMQSWPQWFSQNVDDNIENEVTKRLTDVFWANVREGVENAKTREWRPYLEKNFRNTVTPYCNNSLLNRFLSESINRKINLTCKKRSAQWLIQLTQRDIMNLLQRGVTIYTCSTPNCFEGLLNRHPTHIPLSLGEVISIITGMPTMPS